MLHRVIYLIVPLRENLNDLGVMNVPQLCNVYVINDSMACNYVKNQIIGAFFFVILSAVALSGCAGIGAPTVARDRFDYVTAIAYHYF